MGRANATYKRSRATVNGQIGLVLLPDAWILPNGVEFINNTNDYETNNYDLTEWSLMENAGAVFFPQTGYRNDDKNYYGSGAAYWSSSHYGGSDYSSNESAWCADILNAYAYNTNRRSYGLPVRLIQNY
jgi:hypothetical protein